MWRCWRGIEGLGWPTHSQVQRCAANPQPFLALSVVGQHLVHFVPKRVGMVAVVQPLKPLVGIKGFRRLAGGGWPALLQHLAQQQKTPVFQLQRFVLLGHPLQLVAAAQIQSWRRLGAASCGTPEPWSITVQLWATWRVGVPELGCLAIHQTS